MSTSHTARANLNQSSRSQYSEVPCWAPCIHAKPMAWHIVWGTGRARVSGPAICYRAGPWIGCCALLAHVGLHSSFIPFCLAIAPIIAPHFVFHSQTHPHQCTQSSCANRWWTRFELEIQLALGVPNLFYIRHFIRPLFVPLPRYGISFSLSICPRFPTCHLQRVCNRSLFAPISGEGHCTLATRCSSGRGRTRASTRS